MNAKPFLVRITFTDPRDASRHAEDVANALDAFDMPAKVQHVPDALALAAPELLAALQHAENELFLFAVTCNGEAHKHVRAAIARARSEVNTLRFTP